MSFALPIRTLIATTIAALLVALATSLGVAPAPAAAAQCKGSDKPAYKLAGKRARKATLCIVNKQRDERGLRRLKFSKGQQKAAARHSRTMVNKRCFSHVCPGEPDLVRRLVRTNYLPCACAWGVGENIAYGYGAQSSPRQIVARWMGSAPHRANLLSRSFEHIGIGIARRAPDGSSKAATYTTDFGYRN